jgi:hypothetical protein
MNKHSSLYFPIVGYEENEVLRVQIHYAAYEHFFQGVLYYKSKNKSTFLVLHSRFGSWSHPHYAGKACQGQNSLAYYENL